MANFYKVRIRLVSQEKTCHNGHKVGDEWINSSTGVRYKRISNNSNEVWVEI